MAFSLSAAQPVALRPTQAQKVAALPAKGLCSAAPLQARKPVHAVLRPVVMARAAEQAEKVQATQQPTVIDTSANWVPIMRPEDLPKGVRKEVEVDGRPVLMFWYRNQIYAIESRSPAEGAYSEGFIRAKFTQDYAIECPSTGSLFSLKDGSIVAWYPNNPVLRALTPANLCRPMEIYPVKLSQEAIYVDVSKAKFASPVSKGGADTSVENNNVFSVQPTVYFEGMDPTTEAASLYQEGPKQGTNPAVVLTGVLAIGASVVAGTAIAVYYVFTQ